VVEIINRHAKCSSGSCASKATSSTVLAASRRRWHSRQPGNFDLVISDIGLPDGNGIELMVQLTRNYGLRGIALSGYGMNEDLARTKDAGFLAHLVKPIDFERLTRVIGQVGEAA
jgi:CheY-like chemotaxis protein